MENVERLPLNINILYEIVEKDDLLKNTEFDESSCEEEDDEKLCQTHM